MLATPCAAVSYSRPVSTGLIYRSEEGAKNLGTFSHEFCQTRCSGHALQSASKAAEVTRIFHTLALGLAAVRNANLTISGFIRRPDFRNDSIGMKEPDCSDDTGLVECPARFPVELIQTVQSGLIRRGFHIFGREELRLVCRGTSDALKKLRRIYQFAARCDAECEVRLDFFAARFLPKGGQMDSH
jgi:hypothetical protein